VQLESVSFVFVFIFFSFFFVFVFCLCLGPILLHLLFFLSLSFPRHLKCLQLQPGLLQVKGASICLHRIRKCLDFRDGLIARCLCLQSTPSRLVDLASILPSFLLSVLLSCEEVRTSLSRARWPRLSVTTKRSINLPGSRADPLPEPSPRARSNSSSAPASEGYQDT
jgi:hypothetical protein